MCSWYKKKHGPRQMWILQEGAKFSNYGLTAESPDQLPHYVPQLDNPGTIKPHGIRNYLCKGRRKT